MYLMSNTKVLYYFVTVLSSLPTYKFQTAANEQCLVQKSRCLDPKNFVARFILSTKRNSTGQWITQVRLNNDNSKTNEGSDGAWDVEVQQTTTECGGYEDLEIIATFASPSSKPDSGYKLYPDIGYYKIHTDIMNWIEARQKCLSEGANLAVINSEQEANILIKLFSDSIPIEGATNQDFVFIGFHDIFADGQYLTVFDKPLNATGYYKWLSGEPNKLGGSEHCGSMHILGGLNDIPCGTKFGFICEREL